MLFRVSTLWGLYQRICRMPVCLWSDSFGLRIVDSNAPVGYVFLNGGVASRIANAEALFSGPAFRTPLEGGCCGTVIGDAATVRKDLLANGGNAARNRDAGQTGAAEESMITNAGNAVRDPDAGQTGTAVESQIANDGNAVRDHYRAFCRRKGNKL